MGFGKAQHSPPAPISSQLLFCFVFWLHMGYVYCAEPIEPIEPMGCYATRHHAGLRTNFDMNFEQRRAAFQRFTLRPSPPADPGSACLKKITPSRKFEKRQLKSDS